MSISKYKKPIWKGYVFWFQLNVILEKANYEKSHMVSGCRGLGGRDEQAEGRGFLEKCNYFVLG